MLESIRVEICAGSVSDVVTANRFSEVDRIELNSALELGGLTPSLHTLLDAKQITDKKLICMVRPRPAGFRYNSEEIHTMFADAQEFLEHGADGIVFGFLKEDCTVDEELTEKMVSLIHGYGKEAVFHKAFDETPDGIEAFHTLQRAGVDRILTSGQMPSTAQGVHFIADLVKESNNTLEILPGGGINETNVVSILQKTGCSSFHMTAKESFEDCGSYFAVSENQIRKVLNALQSGLFENRHTKTGEDIDMIEKDAYESE